MKNYISGLFVGIANIVPGLSGGTMFLIFGIFEKLNNTIARILSREEKATSKDWLFLLTLVLGIITGLISFAYILDNVLLIHVPQLTFMFFFFLVTFSTLQIQEKEMSCKNETLGFVLISIGLIYTLLNNYINHDLSFIIINTMFLLVYFALYDKDNKENINFLFLTLGILLIVIINTLSENTSIRVIEDDNLPSLSLQLFLFTTICGLVAGISMIIPGLSGSMVMVIVGGYSLFKSYLANISFVDKDIIVPLLGAALGILVGIGLISNLISKLIKTHKTNFMSFILGLIIASTYLLIPIDLKFTISFTLLVVPIMLISNYIINKTKNIITSQ